MGSGFGRITRFPGRCSAWNSLSASSETLVHLSKKKKKKIHSRRIQSLLGRTFQPERIIECLTRGSRGQAVKRQYLGHKLSNLRRFVEQVARARGAQGALSSRTIALQNTFLGLFPSWEVLNQPFHAELSPAEAA